jgi:hypothetical protein
MLLAAVGPAIAQEKGDAPPAGDPMEAWAKLNAPGENHKLLEGLAGTWTAHAKFFGPPGQPPMESTGTSEQTLILGGRFLRQEYKADMMGQPFQGMGLTGYDNLRKKFIGIWVDSMSTFFMMSEGTVDEGKKVLTFSGSYEDPMNPGTKRGFRHILTIVGPDEHRFEMHEEMDGKEAKVMEIVYKRKK